MTTAGQDDRLTQAPVTRTAMLIRRPVAEVFAAFVEPAITTRFWFTASSGRLEPGAHVRWEWAMYGVSTGVAVEELVPDRRLVVTWGDDEPTTVEWRFTPRTADATFVEITNRGFRGDGDARVAQALDATGGFALVLAGAKALLEHGIELGLVGDRHPDAWVW